MADDPLDPYAYLSSLSAHHNRPGDTSNFNPAFASALARALQQARAAGLPVGVESGFRPPNLTGSAYDAGGNSSHSYGLAADISGLGGANSKAAQQWQQIAEANGLHNPYGIGDSAEFNHWQLPATPLEQNPQVLARLKAASATGNIQNVWNAYPGTQTAGASPIAPSPQPIRAQAGSVSPLGGDHAAFIRNYAQQIGLNPNLALGIAGAEGLNAWGANNPNAASRVDVSGGQPFSFGDFQLNVRNGMGVDALRAGVDPRDPAQWQAADRFALNQMKAGGVGPWKGDPVAAAYLKSGAVPQAPAPAVAAAPVPTAPGPMDPSIIARGGTVGPGAIDPSILAHGGVGPPGPGAAAPAVAGTTINSTAAPGAPAAASSGILPGFKTAEASSGFLGGLQKMAGASGLPGASNQGGSGQGGGQIQPSPMIPGPGARNATPMGGPLLPMSQQLQQAITGYHPPPITYGQTLNSMNTPPTWNGAPPGQAPFAGGPPAGTAPIGTSLGSMQQLQMMDPERYALLYGTGAGNYGGMS